ncbi:hypothetical protein Taro_001200 [Colocasia esculenta]|uniref:Uncharacterized protein n=1 Tax=Colocasia esculenta TaxID=4460 RepID=A0A843TE28_COLES|nr:hypothetical protein [Colocasia esculenta]
MHLSLSLSLFFPSLSLSRLLSHRRRPPAVAALLAGGSFSPPRRAAAPSVAGSPRSEDAVRGAVERRCRLRERAPSTFVPPADPTVTCMLTGQSGVVVLGFRHLSGVFRGPADSPLVPCGCSELTDGRVLVPRSLECRSAGQLVRSHCLALHGSGAVPGGQAWDRSPARLRLVALFRPCVSLRREGRPRLVVERRGFSVCVCSLVASTEYFYRVGTVCRCAVLTTLVDLSFLTLPGLRIRGWRSKGRVLGGFRVLDPWVVTVVASACASYRTRDASADSLALRLTSLRPVLWHLRACPSARCAFGLLPFPGTPILVGPLRVVSEPRVRPSSVSPDEGENSVISNPSGSTDPWVAVQGPGTWRVPGI